jgi:hypothetical protein
MCIASALAAVLVYLYVIILSLRAVHLSAVSLLPETLRSLVGDGGIPPPSIYRAPISLVKPQWITSCDKLPPPRPFQNPFRLFTHPDIVVLLTFNGIFYAVFPGVTAAMSSLFSKRYPYLSETDLGLVFLSIGSGMMVGSSFTGKLLDWEYHRIKIKLEAHRQQDTEKREDSSNQEDFPIEMARLRSTPIYLIIYVAAVIGYGWSMRSGASIAVPLVLHFISKCPLSLECLETRADTKRSRLQYGRLVEHSSDSHRGPASRKRVSCYRSGTSIVDWMYMSLKHEQNNFVRCSLGAAMVSVIDLIITAVGEGRCYSTS